MTDVREATDDLLAEKPALEADLRDLLAVDVMAAITETINPNGFVNSGNVLPDRE